MASERRVVALEARLARRDKTIARLKSNEKVLMDLLADMEAKLANALETNSALSAKMVGVEMRGSGRSKRDCRGGEKGKGKGGGEKGKGKGGKGKGKGKAFTPLSHGKKGGPKPGEDGLPTVSEVLSGRKADETYEADRATCHVHGTPLSEDPVGSVDQAVIDMEVAVRKIDTCKLRRWCPACKKIHTARSPIALPNSRFTLRVDVFIAMLRTFGMPYAKIRAVLSAMLRIRVDENDLVRAVRRVARHLGPLYREFIRHVRKAGVVNVDETMWWIGGKAAWLWDFVTEWTVVLAVEASRGGEVPRRYLEGFDGVLCKDSYGATNGIGSAEQVCLQHYAREVQSTLDYKSPGPEFTRRMAPRLIRLIRDARMASECKARAEKLKWKKRLERRVDRIVGEDWTEPNCKRFVKRLRRERNKMFTFLEIDGVKWHNNDGERPFRQCVTMRKVTGGNRSAEGARSDIVLHSVDQTCKKRGLDFCSSVARYLAGGSAVRRIYPEAKAGAGRGGRRRAEPGGGNAQRLTWPSAGGPSVGDLAAPPPTGPGPPGPPRRRGRQKQSRGRQKQSRGRQKQSRGRQKQSRGRQKQSRSLREKASR